MLVKNCLNNATQNQLYGDIGVFYLFKNTRLS